MVQTNRSLPIGTDSFKEVRENNQYYIDKTLMIEEFIKSGKKVSLITRPRRFGKTLNMTMLREFFDITKDSSAIFDGLNIMNTECAEEINSRPTIYFTFKGVSGVDVEDLKLSLAHVIKEEYYKYYDIFLDEIKLTSVYDEFLTIRNAFKALDKAHKTEDRIINTNLLKRSLATLLKALTAHYNKPVLLLIDEYDQPLLEAHSRGFRKEFSEDIYGQMLGDALKGNEHLGQSLLTGIQRIAKESIFSKLNNIAVYTVADEAYSHYFGLTEQETELALNDNGMLLTSEVKAYYDGYNFGGIDIYNPWSILNYIERKRLEPFWINTSTNLLIRELILGADFDFKEDFEILIAESEVEVTANLSASFMELDSTSTLWGLLINAGYITISEVVDLESYIIRIPNHEVKKEFNTVVELYTQTRPDSLSPLFGALFGKNMERFLKLYRKLILSHVSYYDTIDENSFHMLFLGMSMATQGMYKIKSNREMGDGRTDIFMESLHPSERPHIIVEFKTGEDLKNEADDALNQIFAKRYYAEFAGEVLCIGIAH